MTMLERVHTLKSQVSQNAAERASEIDIEWLHTRNEQLTSIAEGLLAILPAINLLRANGLDVFIPEDETDGLRRATDEILSRFDDDSIALLASKPSPNVARLQALLSHLSGNVKETWQAYCDEINHPVDSGLMLILQNDPSQSQMTSQVNTIRADLIRLREDVPTDQEAFERPTRLANDLRNIISALPSLPDEVKNLIEGIEEGSANLSDITPEIQQWLRDNNLLSRLGISWIHNAH